MHTVVLGNGIVALSTAFRLVQRWTAQSTDTLTIVGRFARPGSATLAAAAMFNSFAEIEAGSLDHPLDLYRFELSHLATQMWPDFERALIAAAGEALPAGCQGCQGFNCGGVTLSQCAPPSCVTQIRPSSVPAQIRFSSSGEGASAYTTPRSVGLASLLFAYLPTLAGTFQVLRVRSGLIRFQSSPPSSLCHTVFDVKYRRCGSVGENMIGIVRTVR